MTKLNTLRHLDGDLFVLAENGEFDIVVHGCNAQGVMGSGIAKTVKFDYPGAFQAYKKGRMIPGQYTIWNGPKFSIVNAITQNHYLPRGLDHFEYEAFESLLKSLLINHTGKRWGFPYIGMGLAGGDSNRILDILREFARQVHEQGGSVTLVQYVK